MTPNSARDRYVASWLLAMALVFAADARAMSSSNALSVMVQGLRSDKGQVACMLFGSKDGYPGEPSKAVERQLSKISARATTCVFSGLKPGTYAAAVMHDENGNGKMDTNFFGIPTEGTGASRDARGKLGPPKFEDAKFVYGGGVVAIVVPIHY